MEILGPNRYEVLHMSNHSWNNSLLSNVFLFRQTMTIDVFLHTGTVESLQTKQHKKLMQAS